MQPPRAGLDVDQTDEAAPVVACLLIGELVMSVRVTIASLVVAAGILSSAGLLNSAAAAPLVPATASIVSANPAVTTQVRWRGHGGGGAAAAAGLTTGLIVGGLVAAPYYHEEPYPYYHPYYGSYAPGYAGPIGYGAPGWEAYCVSRYRSFDPISGT
jgi:hypothetical protein